MTKLQATSAGGTGLQQRLVNELLEEEFRRLRQYRFLNSHAFPPIAERFAQRLLPSGDMVSTSPELRGAALASAARWLSRSAPARAQELLQAAEALSPGELTLIARAFLEGRDDWEKGVEALKPINSSAARTSAALFIRAHNAPPPEVLQWCQDAGISPEQLDADGLVLFLNLHMQAGFWDRASALVDGLHELYWEEAPALLHQAAVTHLTRAVPAELKHLVAQQSVPFAAVAFPLFDDPPGLAARRAAVFFFQTFGEAAHRLGAEANAEAARRTALWLQLRDPEVHAEALTQLKDFVSDPKTAVAYVPLALQFGVSLDDTRVEEALRREQALAPSGSLDVAVARFAMILERLRNEPPTEVLAQFEVHRKLIYDHIAIAAAVELEFDMLVASGSTARAQELLREHEATIGEETVQRLSSRLSGQSEELARLEQDYAAAPSVITLKPLIYALRKQGYSQKLSELWGNLTRTTRSTEDAEEFVAFLLAHRRIAEADTVLGTLEALVPRSITLRSAAAWKAYRAGDFRTAQRLLDALRSERDDRNDRALLVNLLISGGRWPELHAFVESEWPKRTERAGDELLSLAQIAGQIGSPRTKSLLEMAAESSPADPQVLVGCYTVASQHGLEVSAKAHAWLEAAAAQSGDDGPVHRTSLQELMEQGPEWNSRVDEVTTKWRRGELPIWLAAKALRRSALELQLWTVLHNQRESDVRRRAAVPAFSGLHATDAQASDAFALEFTAIITLGVLGLLEQAVARGSVSIAHATLSALFAERSKIGYHQPSQIENARALRGLLADEKLFPFKPTIPADPQLAVLIGDQLAQMIGEAQGEGGATRKLVVRSNPVHRVGSLREEVVDLASHTEVLVSCQGVVAYLLERGLLTEQEEESARSYLQGQEERWPEEASLSDGAWLYLDDLSVSYLETVGVLDKLHAAGLKAHVSQSQITQANALLRLEDVAAEGLALIERIRDVLASGLATGTVRALPLLAEDEEPLHASHAVLKLPEDVDTLVTDDRFLNRFAAVENGTRVISSLGMLSLLKMEGHLSQTDEWRHRTTLRRFGYVLVPLTVDELCTHLNRARLSGNALIEPAELRTIRENLALCQMRGWLNLPLETPWLLELHRVLADAIRRQWTDGVSDAEARAKSQWLLRLADSRTWASSNLGGGAELMARHGLALPLMQLVLGQHAVSETNRDRYAAWLKEIFEALRHEDPPQIEWGLAHARQILLAQLRDTADDAR